MPTAYVTHPSFADHHLQGHPEHAGRIRAIWEALEPLRSRLVEIEAEAASLEAVRRVHEEQYLVALQRITQDYDATVMLNPDTYFTPSSFDIALRAAGGVIQAVDAVLEGTADNALAVVRPPGHHALPNDAMGFCILGNVAIAARHAQAERGLERIMIVDYDVHHGNGTQDMLYDDPGTLFVSTHQSPYYPGTGDLHETGIGPGAGFTVNIPLNGGHGDESYRNIYSELIWPLARRYQPQLILVSAGFDAHWDDPLASMSLSLAGYDHLTRELIAMANALCGGKIVFVTEGGYHLQVLANGVCNVAHALLGDTAFKDPLGAGLTKVNISVQPLIDEIKRIHKL